MKKILTGIAILLAVLVAAWFFLTPESFPSLGVGTVEPAASNLQEATYTEAGDYYTITATYPDMPVIEKAVLDTAEQFKADSNLENLTPEDIEIQGLGENRKYELDITYKTYVSTSHTSHVLTIYSDTLGAHPNAFFRTFTFDAEGREVGLEDLFEPGAPYLQRISEKVYAGVIAQLEERGGGPVTGDMEDIVRMGTSPTPETLQFFYLSGGELHVLIPPYQAAAYAAGSFDIGIPLSELSNILR